jgi:hypothetical protein
LEITPSAAARALATPRLPARSKAAKNDVAIFITFISFLLLSDLAKPMPNRVESEKRLKIASVKEVIDCRALG